MDDLIAGVAGSFVGGILLVLWARFGWGTTRRLPARRLAGGSS